MKKLLEDYSTVAELAKSEGVSIPTAYHWVGRGLPVFKVFGKTLVHLPTAREWMLARIKGKNKPRAEQKAA